MPRETEIKKAFASSEKVIKGSNLKSWSKLELLEIELSSTQGTKWAVRPNEGVPAGWPAWAAVNPS